MNQRCSFCVNMFVLLSMVCLHTRTQLGEWANSLPSMLPLSLPSFKGVWIFACMCKCSPRQRPLHRPNERKPVWAFPAAVPARFNQHCTTVFGLLNMFDVWEWFLSKVNESAAEWQQVRARTYVTPLEWFLALARLLLLLRLAFFWLMLPPILKIPPSPFDKESQSVGFPSAGLRYSLELGWDSSDFWSSADRWVLLLCPLRVSSLSTQEVHRLPAGAPVQRETRKIRRCHPAQLCLFGNSQPQKRDVQSHEMSEWVSECVRSCVRMWLKAFAEIWLDQFVTPLSGTHEQCSFKCNR